MMPAFDWSVWSLILAGIAAIAMAFMGRRS
jgi:hypothetical protein